MTFRQWLYGLGGQTRCDLLQYLVDEVVERGNKVVVSRMVLPVS
jgi:hypothetical protein